MVSIKDLRLIGLKSHDCHALMQQLLPIALKGIDQKHVRFAITKLCLFFNAICVKTVDVSKLKAIQEEIVLTLCLFEQYFPPSFFDIMIHLTVHLVREIELCTPVYMRWMYSFERLMKILKGYVRNQNHPEWCIVESYVAKEAVEFCSKYISGEETISVPNTSNTSNKDIGVGNLKFMAHNDWELSLRIVLENISAVQPYI